MSIEHQPGALSGPENPEERRAPDESTINIEPKRVDSFVEAAQDGRKNFRRLLNDASIRALVRYIEDGGIDIGRVPEVPDLWRQYFRSRDFQASSYTWRNPRLYFLPPRSAASMALHELMQRLENNTPAPLP